MNKIILCSVFVCCVSNVFSNSDWNDAVTVTATAIPVVVAAPCCKVEAEKAAVSPDEFRQKLNEYHQDRAVRQVHYSYIGTSVWLGFTTALNAIMLRSLRSKPAASIASAAVAITMTQFASGLATCLVREKIINKIEEKYPYPSLSKE